MLRESSFCNEWKIEQLGDAVDFLDNLRKPVKASERIEGEYSYFGANGLQGNIDDYIFDEPLVLLAEDGGHFGNPERDIAYIAEGKYWVNNHAHVLKPHKNLDLRFLYRVLQRYDVRPFVKGATRAKLNKGDASRIPIPLPPLAEQKRIAAILDKADTIRRKRQQAIKLADEFLRSVFLDMFGDPVANPKGWKVSTFGEVIETLTDYHSNGSYKTLNENVTLLDEPDYAYMVRTTDLEKKNFVKNVKYISESAYNHLQKSKVFGGEIIINKIGSAGAVYMMPKLERPVSLAMNQFLLRCIDGESNSFYYHLLKTKAGKRELGRRIQGAVTKTITKNAVREVAIFRPPIHLQQKFEEIADTFYDKLNLNIKLAAKKDDCLFNSLSQKAFAGEL